MNDLALVYLMTIASQAVPMIFFTGMLLYTIPVATVSHVLGHRPAIDRRPHNIISPLNDLLLVIDADILDYISRLYLLAFTIRTGIEVLLMLAMLFGFSFIARINMSEADMSALMKFAIVTVALEVIAMTILIVAMRMGWRLPLLRLPQIHRAPPATEITRWEQQSHSFATIHLTRFDDVRQTIIYGRWRDEISGVVSRIALCRAHGVGARTDSYLYHDIPPTPLRPRIIINDLAEEFSDDEL